MLDRKDVPTPKEALLLEAITEVDAILSRLSPQSRRAPEQRRGMCNRSASILKIIGEKFGVKVRNSSAWEMHRLLSGSTAEFNEVFEHTLSLVPEQMILVDLTFCQFLHLDTPEIYADEGYPSGMLPDSPVAIGLLRDGYVGLTDENLRDYLRITSTAEDKTYIESVTVEGLLSGQEYPRS